jgi:hypothetical protein
MINHRNTLYAHLLDDEQRAIFDELTRREAERSSSFADEHAVSDYSLRSATELLDDED